MMSVLELSTTSEGWFTVNEPAGSALGYVRSGPDGELGLLREARSIDRVCDECGLDLGGLVSDEGDSDAADAASPGLCEALERIVAGEASALVVARLDSLADSAAGIGAMMEWFNRTGVRFIAADIGLDTAAEAGRLAASALSAAGQLERRKLQERTRQGLAAAREKGDPRDARPGLDAPGDLRQAQRRGRADAARRKRMAALQRAVGRGLQAPNQGAGARRPARLRGCGSTQRNGCVQGLSAEVHPLFASKWGRK